MSPMKSTQSQVEDAFPYHHQEEKSEKDVSTVRNGPVGCYLVYEPSSGGRLVNEYSKGPIPSNAVGFWCTDEPIQEFKFKQNGGRSDLIKGIAGGDSNRRKYFTGWCLFLKAAKAKKAKVIQFIPESQGVPVDVYGYHQKLNQPVLLELEEGLTDVSDLDAVAVMPRHHEFMRGVKSIALSNFLELGNLAGASTRL